MKKIRKIKSIVIKSFIVMAVLRKNAFCIFPKMLGKCRSTFRRMLMMLLSIIPAQGEISGKNYYT